MDIDIFHAQQQAVEASASMSLVSMEEITSSSSSSSPCSSSLTSSNILLSRSPAIDRYNPIIRDSSRIGKPVPGPPTIPRPQKSHHSKKGKKGRRNPLKENEDHSKKSVEDAKIIKNSIDVGNGNRNWNGNSCGVGKRWSCTNLGEFISPPESTRYLLKEKGFPGFDTASDFFLEDTPKKAEDVNTTPPPEEICDVNPPQDQVVVLKVSLHCRGCERKMRKHLAKMEGVKSFNIDFAAKKVTVSGNVTPVGVLSSISKIKTAQLWSPMQTLKPQ